MAVPTDPAPEVAAWAASGAMALTGRADGPPLGPPVRFVPKLAGIAARLGLGTDDALRLLAERAALAGFTRQGTTSCGGATRLLPTADGWLALCLARPDDVALVPAWLGIAPRPDPADPEAGWSAIAAAARTTSGADLVAAADGLGLPLGVLPPPAASPPMTADLPVRWTPIEGAAAPPRLLAGLRVVDLTSLWAGPLCGSLLADLGAEVTKVESTARPDGARGGSGAFFDLMHAGKRSVALDLASPAGRATLGRLLLRADVVLEGSRPRALRAMGLIAEGLVAAGPTVWVSITGHGRSGADGQRVGFGDDAAVAGGLVAWEDGSPRFCADAIADPVSGIVAAAATVEALDRGGRWLVDVGLAAVSRYVAGPTASVPSGCAAEPAVARRFRGAAAAFGADTGAVVGALR